MSSDKKEALFYIDQARKYGIGKDVEKYILLEADLGEICDLSEKFYDDIFDLLERDDTTHITEEEVMLYFPYVYSISNFSQYAKISSTFVDFISKSSRAKFAVLICEKKNIFVNKDLHKIAQRILDANEEYDIIPLVSNSHESVAMGELRWLVLVSGENYLGETDEEFTSKKVGKKSRR